MVIVYLCEIMVTEKQSLNIKILIVSEMFVFLDLFGFWHLIFYCYMSNSVLWVFEFQNFSVQEVSARLLCHVPLVCETDSILALYLTLLSREIKYRYLESNDAEMF